MQDSVSDSQLFNFVELYYRLFYQVLSLRRVQSLELVPERWDDGLRKVNIGLTWIGRWAEQERDYEHKNAHRERDQKKDDNM